MCDHKNCNKEAEVHVEFNLGINEYKQNLCKKCAKSVLIQGLGNNIGFKFNLYQPIKDVERNHKCI